MIVLPGAAPDSAARSTSQMSRYSLGARRLTLTVMLVLAILTTGSSASADHTSVNQLQCGHVSDGQVRYCTNTHNWVDNLASFTHTMQDLYWSADPGSVWFYQSRWSHSVVAGNPHYLNYWIFWSGGTTVFSDYYGHPLFWYQGQTIELPTGINHIWGGSTPYAAMQIRNTDFGTCGSQWWNCQDYGHQNFLYLNP